MTRQVRQVDERASGEVEISKRQEILQKHVKTNVALQKTGDAPLSLSFSQKHSKTKP